MTSIYTYRGSGEIATQSQIENLKSQMDRTRWLYDEPTGLLTNKVYADGKGPSYTYTPDGKLSTRTWARGIATAYAYNASGRLTGIDYSDTTPDVAYTYDRLGRQKVAQTFLSAHHYAYDPATLAMVSETIIDLQAGTSNVITRATDALGRSTGFSVAGVGDPGQPYSVAYGYDAYGRFQSVESAQSADTFTYTYLSGSDLVSGMTASSGHSWSRSYEPARSLITSVENKHGSKVVSRFNYVNDEIGRRVSRTDSGIAFDNPAFDVYAYNIRSEVIGAQRYHGTDVSDTSKVYGGREFGYNYDPIGNRTSASETIGGESLVKAYTANALNQYTAIANPDAVGLRGSATNTATVTVNGNAALSDSIASDTVPWHYALLADNADGGAYTFANIMAVVNPPGTNTPDLVSTSSGTVYAPPQQEALTYDDDGNLLSDGRFTYTWNGENRLVCAEEQVCPTNRTLRKVEYAYDHQGRMVWKKISHGGAEAQSWEEEKATSYLWDDFNIIAETTGSDSATNTTYNIWGLDINGSIQGAGGVGGLLAVVKDSAAYIPAWDANGNISEYVSTDGSIVAHREYDPFGGTVVATGDVGAFSHWFSTKPWCVVTGLSEYQYRKYSPVLGRWLNRDPLEEEGSDNLGLFCVNNPIWAIDLDGLLCVVPWDYMPVDGFLVDRKTNFLPEWTEAKASVNGHSATVEFSGNFVTEEVLVYQKQFPSKVPSPKQIRKYRYFDDTSWTHSLDFECLCAETAEGKTAIMKAVSYDTAKEEPSLTVPIPIPKQLTGVKVSGKYGNFLGVSVTDTSKYLSREVYTRTLSASAKVVSDVSVSFSIFGKRAKHSKFGTSGETLGQMTTPDIQLTCDVSGSFPTMSASAGGRVVFNERKK